jgi:hypothetical protein
MTQPAERDNLDGSVHGSNGGNSEPDRESRLAQSRKGNEGQDAVSSVIGNQPTRVGRLGPKGRRARTGQFDVTQLRPGNGARAWFSLESPRSIGITLNVTQNDLWERCNRPHLLRRPETNRLIGAVSQAER